jgi:hypothetical protein
MKERCLKCRKEFSIGGGERSHTQLSRRRLWKTRSSLLSIFRGQDQTVGHEAVTCGYRRQRSVGQNAEFTLVSASRFAGDLNF